MFRRDKPQKTVHFWSLFKSSVDLLVKPLFMDKWGVYTNKSIENLKIRVIWLVYYLGQTLNEKVTIHSKQEIQSNFLMRSPLLMDHLLSAATFSVSLHPKYSSNIPVLRDQFWLSFGWLFGTGLTDLKQTEKSHSVVPSTSDVYYYHTCQSKSLLFNMYSEYSSII